VAFCVHINDLSYMAYWQYEPLSLTLCTTQDSGR